MRRLVVTIGEGYREVFAIGLGAPVISLDDLSRGLSRSFLAKLLRLAAGRCDGIVVGVGRHSIFCSL